MSTTQKYDAQMTEMAAQAFARHQLVQDHAVQGLRAWEIRRRDGGSYWTRVIATPDRLVFTGDGPDLIVRGGPGDLVAKVHWFATSGVGYLRTKMLAGPSSECGRLGMSWDASQAVDEIRARLAEAQAEAQPDEDGEACRHAAAEVKTWRAVLDEFSPHGNHADLVELLSRHVEDYFEYTLGERVDSVVFYARAAARRLAQLLEADTRRPKAGPPCPRCEGKRHTRCIAVDRARCAWCDHELVLPTDVERTMVPT